MVNLASRRAIVAAMLEVVYEEEIGSPQNAELFKSVKILQNANCILVIHYPSFTVPGDF